MMIMFEYSMQGILLLKGGWCNDDVIIEQSRLCNMDYINVVCNIITLSSFVPTNVLYCSLLILIRLIHINSLEARLHV